MAAAAAASAGKDTRSRAGRVGATAALASMAWMQSLQVSASTASVVDSASSAEEDAEARLDLFAEMQNRNLHFSKYKQLLNEFLELVKEIKDVRILTPVLENLNRQKRAILWGFEEACSTDYYDVIDLDETKIEAAKALAQRDLEVANTQIEYSKSQLEGLRIRRGSSASTASTLTTPGEHTPSADDAAAGRSEEDEALGEHTPPSAGGAGTRSGPVDTRERRIIIRALQEYKYDWYLYYNQYESGEKRKLEEGIFVKDFKDKYDSLCEMNPGYKDKLPKPEKDKLEGSEKYWSKMWEIQKLIMATEAVEDEEKHNKKQKKPSANKGTPARPSIFWYLTGAVHKPDTPTANPDC